MVTNTLEQRWGDEALMIDHWARGRGIQHSVVHAPRLSGIQG